MLFTHLLLKSVSFVLTLEAHTNIGMPQGRLAQPLGKDDTQIHKAYHIFEI